MSHRHDHYLAYIVDTLKATQPEHITIHADLEWCRFNCGTVPAELVLTGQKPEHITIHADLEGCHVNGGTVLTGQKPDLVILDRSLSPAKVYLVELTIPWDSEAMINNACDRNKKRYTYLCSDIDLGCVY